jgi:hypothetical protein
MPPATLTPTVIPKSPTSTPDLARIAIESSHVDSPDGKWTVRIEISEPVLSSEVQESFYVRVSVISQNAQTVWVPIAEWRGFGLGFLRPIVFHWSQDGEYLYLADYAVPDGCPGFGYTSNISRVNLRRGAIDAIAPQLEGVLSLSPDETTLVALGYKTVSIHQLHTGQDRVLEYTVEADFWISGNIVWSPDGMAFLFAAIIDGCSPPEQEASSLFLVNVRARTIKALVSNDARRLIVKEWSETDQALLTDKDGIHWWLDTNTGILTNAPE